jgi:hypothetical protein
MDLFQFQFIGAEHKTKNSYASVSVWNNLCTIIRKKKTRCFVYNARVTTFTAAHSTTITSTHQLFDQ